MSKAPDLSTQVKDALPASLPSVEQVDAKLAEIDREIAINLKSIEKAREHIAEIRQARAAWQRVRDALVPPATRQYTKHQEGIAGKVLALFSAGNDVSVADIKTKLGLANSTATGNIRRLIEAKKIVRADRGLYRLAGAPRPSVAPLSAPPAQQPSPPRPAPSSSLAHLEPLNGAAPKARCPRCPKPVWVDAIGMKEGDYIFRCPDCSTTFREAHGHRDRP